MAISHYLPLFFFLIDPVLLVDVNKWKEQLNNFSAQEIGKTLVFLNGSSLECRFRECNLGNLICDAMVGGLLYIDSSFLLFTSSKSVH